MNKQDRKHLCEAIDLLEKAREIVSEIAKKEDESFNNLNDGLQATERGQRLESNASNLDEADSQIEESINLIQESLED